MEPLTLLADEQLVKMYKIGNNDAFEVLLNRYKDRVFTHIYLIVHDKELAEDIFQDTFIKAILCIKQGRYTESGKFLPWINRIAHNLIIDYFRRDHNDYTLASEPLGNDLLNNVRLYENSIEETLINEQILNDVVKLIGYLPESQQKVVRMRFFEDLSFKEIADQTGVSINTALGRMRYALLNMRRLAKEHNVALEL